MANQGVGAAVRRWTVRIVGAVLTLMLTAILVFVAINWRDEPLLPQAAAILDAKVPDPPPADNLFFTLIGFSSAASDDMNAEGQRIFGLWQHAPELPPGDSGRFDIYKRAGVQVIRFSGDAAGLCSFGADDQSYRCIADAATRTEAWNKLLTDNAVFLKRYRALPVHPAYFNKFPADPFGPMMSWSDVLKGKRLLLTSLALQVNGGDVDGATAALANDTRFWRSLLETRNVTLLDKMVASAQVRANFVFASELLRIRSLTSQQYDVIDGMLAPLSADERSLRGALEGEIRFANAALQSAASHRATLANLFGGEPAAEHLLAVFGDSGFQLHATINRIYRNDETAATLSEKPCTEFSGYAAAEAGLLRLSFFDYWYNPSGNILVTIATPSYGTFGGRLCDLEGLDHLVALQLNLRRNSIAGAQIPAFIKQAGNRYADPYTGQPMEWNAAAHGLSFAAADPRNRSRMPWPI